MAMLMNNFLNHFSQDIILVQKQQQEAVIFYCVNLMYYKCNKINFKCGGSYIGYPGCLKTKKSNNKSEK